MMEKEHKEPIDYEASVTERKRSFIARTTGAVVGVATGIATGKFLLKKSLHTWLQERLFGRDWSNGNVVDVIKGVASGKYDTISGSVTDSEKLNEAALARAEVIKNSKERGVPIPDIRKNGTLTGDPAANKALKDLYASHLIPDPEKPGETMFKEGFLKTAVEKFKKKLKEHEHIRDKLITKLETQSFAKMNDEGRAALAKVRNVLAKEEDLGVREAAVKELKNLGFIKGDEGAIHKFFEEERNIHANFVRHTNEAKKLIVDTPVYDEMMKKGHAPGRMGLGMRQAHNKNQIFAFSTVAAVGMGYMAYRAVKSYLHRNDKGKDEEQTFQEGVAAGREAALHEQQSLI